MPITVEDNRLRSVGGVQISLRGGSNRFQDLLQTVQRTSQVQHRESTRRMIYRREVEHLEMESRDVDHRSVTHEDLLNKLRSGASDYYRNGRRNQFSQW